MIIRCIKKASCHAVLLLVTTVGMIACDDTRKPQGYETKSIPSQTSGENEKMADPSDPLYRASGQGKDYEWGKDHIFVKLSSAETGGALTLIQDNLKAGFNLGMHLHNTHSESFFILEGEVEFETGSTSFTAKKGSVVHLPAGIPHAAKSTTGGRMLMFYAPGGFDEMLAEIENASWFQRMSPFARTQRDKKYDFIKIAGNAPAVSIGPEPVFLEQGEGQITQLEFGNRTVKLSGAETDGQATMIEETLKPGFERISSSPSDEAEVLYVLEGALELHIADRTQSAEPGDTLYFPDGFPAKIKSLSEAKFLVYRFPLRK